MDPTISGPGGHFLGNMTFSVRDYRLKQTRAAVTERQGVVTERPEGQGPDGCFTSADKER